MADKLVKLYENAIRNRDKRIQELEAAIKYVTYTQGNAVRVSRCETEDLTEEQPILLAVHNGQ